MCIDTMTRVSNDAYAVAVTRFYLDGGLVSSMFGTRRLGQHLCNHFNIVDSEVFFQVDSAIARRLFEDRYVNGE